MSTIFRNLTPHAVTMFFDDEELPELVIPSEGPRMAARIAENVSPDGIVGGFVPTFKVELGEVVNLPNPENGVVYIVSMPLLMGLKALGISRSDCYYPHGQVRDLEGRIAGCRNLAQID